METIARYLMLGGVILFLIGGGIFLAAKFGLPLGRLPGDIRIERDGFSFYFLTRTSRKSFTAKPAKSAKVLKVFLSGLCVLRGSKILVQKQGCNF